MDAKQLLTMNVLLIGEDDDGREQEYDEIPIDPEHPLTLTFEPGKKGVLAGPFTITVSMRWDRRLEFRLSPSKPTAEPAPGENTEVTRQELVRNPQLFQEWFKGLMDNKPHEGDHA